MVGPGVPRAVMKKCHAVEGSLQGFSLWSTSQALVLLSQVISTPLFQSPEGPGVQYWGHTTLSSAFEVMLFLGLISSRLLYRNTVVSCRSCLDSTISTEPH